jgi:uncharacterized protein (TIGR00297 family)
VVRAKAIPESRDRLQSAILMWVVGLALVLPSAVCVGLAIAHPHGPVGAVFLKALIVSVTFAGLALALNAATPAAALCGAMVCLLVTSGTGRADGMPLASGLSPLMALFVLTFAATRAGRARKAKAGLAESPRGRNAAQIVANLGASGLVIAFMASHFLDYYFDLGVANMGLVMTPALVLAALCEATADTVSSEIGQAFGGAPVLITSLRRVEPGTDGAITWLGTLAGAAGAALVAAVGFWAMRMTPVQAAVALVAGVAGLLFDSMLGATAERRGWLGNDLVNFSSTVFGVFVALALTMIFRAQS